MGLIDHHRIGRSQDIPETILLQGQIGEQQVMIDDHHLRLLRLAPRLHQVTAANSGQRWPDSCHASR